MEVTSLRITCFTDKKFPDETGMLTGGKKLNLQINVV